MIIRIREDHPFVAMYPELYTSGLPMLNATATGHVFAGEFDYDRLSVQDQFAFDGYSAMFGYTHGHPSRYIE